MSRKVLTHQPASKVSNIFGGWPPNELLIKTFQIYEKNEYECLSA
jgi:hypothetical protein